MGDFSLLARQTAENDNATAQHWPPVNDFARQVAGKFPRKND